MVGIIQAVQVCGEACYKSIFSYNANLEAWEDNLGEQALNSISWSGLIIKTDSY